MLIKQDERMVSSSYTGMPDTMLRHEYQVSPSSSDFAEGSGLIPTGGLLDSHQAQFMISPSWQCCVSLEAAGAAVPSPDGKHT